MSQLALPLRLDDYAEFTSFLSAGNELLVQLLATIADGEGEGCWLFGEPSIGKSHLLQAVCARAGERAAYLPMTLFGDADAVSIAGFERRDVVCVDDFHLIAGDSDWERALFGLYNEILQRGGQLVVAAATPPRECPIELPDLASRMSQLPVFRVHALADEDRAAALQLRAAHRGLDMPDETARYLLNHSRRDMRTLYALLDALDLEALRAQRRLTVPFVRQVLKSNPIRSL